MRERFSHQPLHAGCQGASDHRGHEPDSEKHGGQRILQAEQIIGAVGVPESSAQILGVQANSPGLWVRRYYLGSAERLLSVSLNVYPLDRFEFATRWRLEADISTN